MILLKSVPFMWNIPQCGKNVTQYGRIFYNSSTSDCGTVHFYYPCKQIDMTFLFLLSFGGSTVLSYFLFDSVSIFYLSKLWVNGRTYGLIWKLILCMQKC